MSSVYASNSATPVAPSATLCEPGFVTGNTSEDSANNGSNPARHFGRQVRKERIARGWTLRDLARETGIVPGHLSNIENGKRPPTERVASKMDEVFPGRRGWFTEYHHDSQEWAPPGYRNWAEYENAATHLRVWCPGTLHGLVQPPEYARALFETVPGVPSEVITARIQARMNRQRTLLHRDNPPFVWIGVDELALFREVASPEVMAAGLDNLLGVAGLPQVTVQVVPGVAHPGPISELIVSDNPAAYCEHMAGGFTYTDLDTVSMLDGLITSIQSESRRASESVQLIERVRDIWATGVNPLTRALLEAPA